MRPPVLIVGTPRRWRMVAVLSMTLIASVSSHAQESEKRMASPEQILVGYGVAVTPDGLLEALKNEQGEIRENAAHLLGERSVKAAIPALQIMLGDDYPRARIAAAGALVRLGADSGTPVLVEALSNSDAVLAAAAARAFVAARRDVGYEVLSARVRGSSDLPRDRVLLVRALAAYRSISTRESAVRDGLMGVLKGDPAAEVRRAAASELTKLSGPAVIGALAEAAKNDPDQIVRGVAQAFVDKSRR